MSERGKYRILIVDDHPGFRAGVACCIAHTDDLEVCGEADSVAQAMTTVEVTKPDLVTVDLSLRGSHGLDLIKNLHTLYPKLAMLVVSLHDESLYGAKCFHAGARGYLDKQQATREIIQAIRRILAGGLCFSEPLLARLASQTPGVETPTGDLAQLSDRELQVFELLGQGWETKQIAAALCLDTSTVETYRRRIKEKLGMETTTAVLRSAVIWTNTPGQHLGEAV